MRGSRIIIYCLLIVFLITPSVHSRAAPDTHIILLMDASGSMKKTDPRNLRLDAGELFVRLLDDSFALSILSFHSEVTMLAHKKNPVKDRNRLIKKIRSIGSYGLHTDLYSALRSGIEEATEFNGKNIIILLSDGKMDTGDTSRDAEKRRLIKEELLPLAKSRNIPVYTIAFSELSDKELLREIAIKTSAIPFMVKSASEIHRVFTRIFNEIKQPDSLPVRNREFLVDSSIKDINIVVTKQAPGREIVLEDPFGKRYTYLKHPAFMRWFSTTRFEMIGMEKPEPGRWKIHYSAREGNQVFILTDLKLKVNKIENIYYLGEQLYIETWLEEKGQRLDNIPILLRNIEFSAILNTDSRLKKEITLRDDGVAPDRIKEDGIYTEVVKMDEEGDFLLRIVARGKTFERKIEKLFTVRKRQPPETGKDTRTGKTVSHKDISKKPPEGSNTREDPLQDGMSWKWVIIKFIITNMVIFGIAGGIFFIKKKRGLSVTTLYSRISTLRSLLKRRKNED
ncbi:MAG: VWA domain-containing protein [Nitrospirae bacterium]|nr:VWA domain-containing protein [Nitrospirota bacterium]